MNSDTPKTVIGRIVSSKSVVFALAFAVAFCSIVYELAFAEMLRTFYGGTVTQYVMNVGLFMFGFGIGSSIYDYLDKDRVTFTHIEMGLAVCGPLGLGWIIGVNLFDPAYIFFGEPTPDDPTAVYDFLTQLPYFLSYIPALVVGMLSGVELPFLTDISDDYDDWSPPALYSRVVDGAIDRLPLCRSPENTNRTAFSVVLGIDYFGSLAGTSAYALLMFPTVGLIPSVIILGLINGVAALGYHLWFVASMPQSIGDVVFLRFAEPLRVAFLITLIFTSLWAGLVVNNESVEREISEEYLESQMEMSWPSHQMNYTLISTFTTKYQRVSKYHKTWKEEKRDYWGSKSDTCVYLDGQVQICESWGEEYHTGLVDVPMSYFENQSAVDVLVIGGGDWAAVNHLSKYNASVDLVDVDREFMNHTKNDRFFTQFHDNAYKYEKLTVHHQDAYTYLRNTEEKYDLILLDLPGARSDELSKFYTKEFFISVRKQLSKNGLVATWGYSRYQFPAHYKTYLTTVKAAGFDTYRPYTGFADVDNDTDKERFEYYYVFSPGQTNRTLNLSRSKNPNAKRVYRKKYTGKEWKSVPSYDGVEVHSIFDPNYDILI